jgi:hypothetical protein
VEEAAHPTVNMDRELSTLLSIMDELEDEAVLEESAFDEDLDEYEDEEPGDGEGVLVCAPCAPPAEGPMGKSVVSTGPSELAVSSLGAISGLGGLANGYLRFHCQ